MIRIGWKNLMRDRLRMLVAVVGVIIAVVLVTMEVGMLLGMVQNASLLNDRSRADIWVSTVDVKTFDFATPMESRKKHLIQSVPGVERVEELNVSYSIWKLPTGGNTNCQVIGFDPRGQLHALLGVREGRVDHLINQEAVLIDEAERVKLGNPHIGDYVEIMERRAKVAGFTFGMRSFTTTPYVFTDAGLGRQYGWITNASAGERSKQTIYFLVKTAPGANIEEVCRSIRAAVPDVDALTREAFSWRTRKYWLLETGVGFGFLAAALLGLIIGGVIVAQTLYAMTVEKISEFGVLKAMGASMRELSAIVLAQGMICGALGLALGLAISFCLSSTGSSVTTVLVPWPLVAGVTLLTVLLCSSASLLSIARLRKVEPALVFRT